MLIRAARDEDASALSALATAAYTPYLERLPDGVRPDPLDADYAASIRHGGVLVADDAGEVVGLLVLVVRDDDLLLENIAVDPARQGQGIGSALLAIAEDAARAAARSVIALYTNEVMVENQRLYERLGYVETERRGERGLRRVFYAKRL